MRQTYLLLLNRWKTQLNTESYVHAYIVETVVIKQK